MARLATDECCIGKVPAVNESDYESLFTSWTPSVTGMSNWEIFREGMNSWKWRMMDREILEEVINDFFAKAQRLKM